MSGAAPVPHVPAWRRLGLKLKYAKDVPEQRPVSVVEASQRQQSPSPDYGVKAVNGAKKRKLSSTESEPGAQPPNKKLNGRLDENRDSAKSRRDSTSKKPDADVHPKEIPQRSRLATPPSPPQSIGKQRQRKSVSFTPETKTQDGTGAREVFDSWRPDDHVDEGSMSQPISQLAGKPADEVEGKKKPKKPKKSKSTLLENQASEESDSAVKASKAANSRQTPTDSSPVLIYLDSFQNHKDRWKFSKARQNQLFKQILDPDKIPPAYNKALLEYLDGLQGQASRSQLRERASQVREQDKKDGIEEGDTNMSPKHKDMRNQPDRVSTDEERHKAAYRNAVRQFKKRANWDAILQEEEDLQLSKEWEVRLMRRQRAEQMLRRLGEDKDETKSKATVNTPQRQKTGIDFEVSRTVEKLTDENGNVIGQKRKRKRKRRTAMPTDDSSSDESSSSDSDSDSDAAIDKKDVKKLRQFINGDGNANNETSDSESEDDSSSSGSDTGSDDESKSSRSSSDTSSDAESDSSSDENSDSD